MMIRVWSLVLVFACPLPALAQEYHPAVPPPSMYGAYGYQGASTAAGSAMNGMSNVISAKGDYNLSTSEAAENLTQAQSKEIQNRQQYTDTYFAMRQTNTAAREKEAGPKPTEQQLVQFAHEGDPRPLDPSERDPVTGSLNWPDLLQFPEFNSQRDEVNRMLAKQANYGALTYADKSEVHKAVDFIFADMKKNIRKIDPPDYVASRTFLNSVLYAITKNELQ
jgi:hypothetical protein